MKRFAAIFAFAVGTTLSVAAGAQKKDEPITISTIADPPAEAGIDSAGLREAMLEALHGIDTKDVHRPISVSLSLIKTQSDPTASCTINIAVHDRKRGNILGTTVGSASASDKSKGDQRANVARMALTNAINRVPDVVVAAN